MSLVFRRYKMIEDKLKLSDHLSWTFCSCNFGTTHISCHLLFVLLQLLMCFVSQERESLIQSSISMLWDISELNLATVYSSMTG